MAQRKLDVVLDSVKRLLRVGATANLVNLLQTQFPADLAQVFSGLSDKDRQSAFSLLVERNSRLAMEGLSGLGRDSSPPGGPPRRSASCSRSCPRTTPPRSSITCRRRCRRRSSS